MTRRAQSPSIEELLEHGDWVWRLARSLVRSDHDADDIVQETWVAALRRPPHPGSSHAARSAWLTTVVRHAAARLLRSKERRDDKELAAAQTDEAPAADRLHERESARQVLVDEVLALPQPYSEVLLLRFFDELSPRQVAHRLGQNRSTVRNQIQRGLELLRGRLARRRDQRDRPWLLALVPLIPRTTLLSSASTGAAVVSAKSVVSAAAVVAVVSIGWLMWPLRSPADARSVATDPADSGSEKPADTPSAMPVVLAEERDERHPIVTEESSISAATPSEPETVRGRVVDSKGWPVSGAEIWTSEWDLGGQPAGRTNAEGHFEVPRPQSRFQVGARHSDYAPSLQRRFDEGEALGDEEIQLTLPGAGGRLSLRVVDPSDRPVAGAIALLGSRYQEALLPSGEPARTPPPWVCQTGEDGRASASGLATGAMEMTVRAKGFRLWTGSCTVFASQEVELTVRLREGATITGRISDPAGQPLQGVRVYAGPRQDHDPAIVSTQTDEQGQYELPGVAEGEIRVSARSSDRGNTVEELEVTQGERLVWNAVLRPRSSIHGRVIDEEGQPLQNWLAALIKPGDSGHWLRNSKTDAEGRFELLDPPLETIDLELRSPRLWDTGPIVLVEDVHGGEQELVLRVPHDRMPTAFISGRIVDAEGLPCADGRITYSPEDYPNRAWEERTQPDGTFRIGPLRPVRYRLFVSDNELSSDDLGEVETAADTTKELGDIVLEPSGSLVVVPTPEEIEDITYQLAQSRNGEPFVFRSWQGLPERIPLRPGDFVLEARNSKYESERVSFRVSPGSAATVHLQLLSRMAYSLEFVCPDGAKVNKVDVELRGYDDGALKKSFTVSSDAQGQLISRFELEPGIYALTAVADNGYKGRLTMSWGGARTVPTATVRLRGD
jgi:RNA polymerase sigma factor (sigma-70 family)